MCCGRPQCNGGWLLEYANVPAAVADQWVTSQGVVDAAAAAAVFDAASAWC